MNKLGRRSKLTPETQEMIVNAISDGNYYEAACRYAGVSYRTFRLWMTKGEEAQSGKFFQLFHAVRGAEAEAEVRAVEQWQSHMPDSWQASRDFLARRHPQRWMQKERHELSGADGKAIDIEINWDDGDGSSD